jgi:hypothetical protein
MFVGTLLTATIAALSSVAIAAPSGRGSGVAPLNRRGLVDGEEFCKYGT